MCCSMSWKLGLSIIAYLPQMKFYLSISAIECQTSGDFECSNGRCIKAALHCDGFNHCGDGSDESACYGKPTALHLRYFNTTTTIIVVVIIITASVLMSPAGRIPLPQNSNRSYPILIHSLPPYFFFISSHWFSHTSSPVFQCSFCYPGTTRLLFF